MQLPHLKLQERGANHVAWRSRTCPQAQHSIYFNAVRRSQDPLLDSVYLYVKHWKNKDMDALRGARVMNMADGYTDFLDLQVVSRSWLNKQALVVRPMGVERWNMVEDRLWLRCQLGRSLCQLCQSPCQQRGASCLAKLCCEPRHFILWRSSSD